MGGCQSTEPTAAESDTNEAELAAIREMGERQGKMEEEKRAEELRRLKAEEKAARLETEILAEERRRKAAELQVVALQRHQQDVPRSYADTASPLVSMQPRSLTTAAGPPTELGLSAMDGASAETPVFTRLVRFFSFALSPL